MTGDERKWLFPNVMNLTNFDVRPHDGLEQMDIQDMTRFADGTFDTFVAIHVLNHVRDDNKALREIARILAPGGTFICTTPVQDPTSNKKVEEITRDYGSDALDKYGVATWRVYGGEEFRAQLLSCFAALTEFPWLDMLSSARETVFVTRT